MEERGVVVKQQQRGLYHREAVDEIVYCIIDTQGHTLNDDNVLTGMGGWGTENDVSHIDLMEK